MGVVISKPAINLREQLTELKAQQGYEERQFHFDNLVTNGTFDTDTDWTKGTGWTINTTTGKAVHTQASGAGRLSQQYDGFEVGKVYRLTATIDTTGDLSLANTAASFRTTDNTSDLAVVSNFSGDIVADTENNIEVFWTANATSALVHFYSNDDVTIDNVSVYTSDGTDVAFTMPKGWKPLHVYDDGVLQREGSAEDYEVTFDGFNYYVKPTVANPGARNTVIGVRA